jgi:hypothetical protein
MSNPNQENSDTARDALAQRRMRARERFVLSDVRGITLDGLPIAAWMELQAARASQDQAVECDAPLIVDAGPQPPA